MTVFFEQFAAAAELREFSAETPLALSGAGLWAAAAAGGEYALPDGRALAPGSLLLAGQPVQLVPQGGHCRLLAARLTGSVAAAVVAALPQPVFLARGETCPHAAELLAELIRSREAGIAAAAQSALCYELLCELSSADEAPSSLPPLVAEAAALIRSNYAGLYGVEELSDQLGVSKSHLVRAFSAAMGLPPGRYLTQVRIEAAKRLLLHREYTLDIVASLCGFSGANYLCRVFKKETGLSPAAWRGQAMQGAAGLSPAEAAQERALYV